METEIRRLRAMLARRDGGRGRRFAPEPGARSRRSGEDCAPREGAGSRSDVRSDSPGRPFGGCARHQALWRSRLLRALCPVNSPLSRPAVTASRGWTSRRWWHCWCGRRDYSAADGASLGVRRPVDLRKGYNGLVGIVENELRSDPMGGELCLFVNAKRTGCKVLLWDGTGPCIFMNQPSSHYTSVDCG
jgi:hypothetical protein